MHARLFEVKADGWQTAAAAGRGRAEAILASRRRWLMGAAGDPVRAMQEGRIPAAFFCFPLYRAVDCYFSGA
jgi:hypothetical protein